MSLGHLPKRSQRMLLSAVLAITLAIAASGLYGDVAGLAVVGLYPITLLAAKKYMEATA